MSRIAMLNKLLAEVSSDTEMDYMEKVVLEVVIEKLIRAETAATVTALATKQLRKPIEGIDRVIGMIEERLRKEQPAPV